MATYAIGDVQGCRDSLDALARILPAGPNDELCFVGDLVNRGPRSLDTLRFARDRPNTSVVLGNHDLHLLARAEGLRPKKRRDTLDDVLEAADRDELLEWIASRPFVIERAGWSIVHAGFLPEWSSDQALRLAEDVSSVLRDPNTRRELLEALQDRRPTQDQIIGALRVFTLIRTCDPNGRPDFEFAGPPSAAAAGQSPWFLHPHNRSRPVAFGHWAMLGLNVGTDFAALDSGCVWGKQLSALRLEDRALFQVDARESSQDVDAWD